MKLSREHKRGCLILIIVVIAGACQMTMRIKNGTQAYQYKQYAVAVDMLEKEIEKENNREVKARKAFMLARSHDILQNYGEALRWYDVSEQLNPDVEKKEALAESLKKNERYNEAVELYTELYQLHREPRYVQQIEISKRAANDMEDPPAHIIEPLRGNSIYRDYAPVIFEDDFLVFSSDRESSTGKGLDNWTGHPFSDLFIYNLQTHKVSNFDALLNTAAHEGTACFSSDRNEIFFTRTEALEQGKPFNRIYYSQRPNGFWLDPEPLMFFGEGVNFGHPTLIENDSVLVFSASGTGASDSHDLYYSVRLANGWSEAELMPSYINTLGDEQFPTSDGDTLYFSSDQHPGYGGLDIFRTFLRPDGSWAPVENLGYPVNSGADDFGLAIRGDLDPDSDIELQGYFTSSRNTGFNDDLFFFTIYKDEEPEEPPAEEVVSEDDASYNIYVAGRVVERIFKDGDPNKEVIEKRPIPEAYIRLAGPSDSIAAIYTKENGLFVQQIQAGRSYEVIAKKRGYLSSEVSFDTHFEPGRDTTINIELALDRIILDREIVLRSIYYDYDKWDIRPDAKGALDSLSHLLKINPGIDIRLSSHTDCRGEEAYNMELSQKRAQSAVDYLVSTGIDTSRLTARGFGESRLAVDCICEECTETQHQVNRRTAFAIIKASRDQE